MLKLTYTETSFHLECVTQSLEEWIQARVIFAVRVGQCLYVQPSTASFLLPVHLTGVEVLKAVACCDDKEMMTLDICDTNYMEVTLRGSWLSDDFENAVGLFVTAMSDRTEIILYKLWLEAQACASVFSD